MTAHGRKYWKNPWDGSLLLTTGIAANQAKCLEFKAVLDQRHVRIRVYQHICALQISQESSPLEGLSGGSMFESCRLQKVLVNQEREIGGFCFSRFMSMQL
jgi:hypothetical protein